MERVFLSFTLFGSWLLVHPTPVTRSIDLVRFIRQDGSTVIRNVIEIEPRLLSIHPSNYFDGNVLRRRKREEAADADRDAKNKAENEANKLVNESTEPPDPSSTARPDELDTNLQGTDEKSKLITPNVTCITADDARQRLRSVNADFGVKRNKKCPKKLPCQGYLSCSIWRTGFVSKAFNIEKELAVAFYSELFAWVNDRKLSDILQAFDECSTYYALEKLFEGGAREAESSNEIGHSHNHGKKKKHKAAANPVPHEELPHSRKRRETVAEHEAKVAAGDVARSGAVADEDTTHPDNGLTDCRVRVEDFFECFDTAMMKGLCYWPPVEIAK